MLLRRCKPPTTRVCTKSVAATHVTGLRARPRSQRVFYSSRVDPPTPHRPAVTTDTNTAKTTTAVAENTSAAVLKEALPKLSISTDYAVWKKQFRDKLKELSPASIQSEEEFIKQLRSRSPAERLKDPNLKFEGEDEIPSEYEVLMREVDAQYNQLKAEVRELFKDPDFILYERVLNARIRAMELAWLIDPTPPKPTDHAELAAKRKEIIDYTSEEFRGFFKLRKQMNEKKEKQQLVRWLKEIEYLKIQIKKSTDKATTLIQEKELMELEKSAYELNKKMTTEEARRNQLLGAGEGKLYKHYDRLVAYREEILEHGETPFSPTDKILAHLHARERMKQLEEEEKMDANKLMKLTETEGWEDVLGRKPTKEEEEILFGAWSIYEKKGAFSPFNKILPKSEEELAIEALLQEEEKNNNSLFVDPATSLTRQIMVENIRARYRAKAARDRRKEKRLDKFLRKHGVDVDKLNKGIYNFEELNNEMEAADATLKNSTK